MIAPSNPGDTTATALGKALPHTTIARRHTRNYDPQEEMGHGRATSGRVYRVR